jgi:hypothetical protein
MTRKLKLDVDDLSVESFRIDPSVEEQRGTVRGNSDAISFDASCDCTSDITAENCVTEPFGGCSQPGQTFGGTRIPGDAMGYC